MGSLTFPGMKTQVNKLTQPAKIAEAQSGSKRSSPHRIEYEESRNSEWRQKLNGRRKDVASITDIRAERLEVEELSP